MDSQWQPYQDPLMGRPAQFNNGLTSNPPQPGPKYGGQPQQSQPPVGYTYEAFQTPGVAAKPASAGMNSKSVSMASSPAATPRSRDYVTDADTTMEDADPYNRAKYSTRPSHHSRPSSQYFPSEESSAARSQLSAPFGQDGRSPRSASISGGSQQPGRGPVPKFQKIKSVQELKPRVNAQPPFRRANPEGGFISPLQALTTHLPATYRICNPGFNYESSRNPRRVLTKPSKGVKNDGYDNEDSDYILYVNDILGSEEAGHKNRYLILDVLGQGTFGQVVKCQNLKTQEVVAVKVIKNKTAYFNQSMMEVSVLDLVCRIVEMLGLPPTWMLEMGKQSGEFFEKTQDEFGRKTYRLKSLEQYSREHGTKEQPSKKYFQASTLEEIIRSYPMPRKNMKQAEIERELNNRVAFIDFVRGLLSINPLERWSPQQAKLHPFITQQKFTGPFVPPMNLKYSSLNKTVAPGIQQQQQAEAASKQRAAQAAHAQSAAQTAFSMQLNQFHTPTHAQPPPPMYNGVFTGHQQGAPPPYPTQQPPGYGHQMNLMPGQMPQSQYAQSQSLYAQATTRAGRQRASTMDPQGGGVPPTIQRVASHLDPNAPIRLQPSPAYYPPPPDGYVDTGAANQRRRGSRAGGTRNRDFIRTLEDGVLGGDGFMGQNQWH
ncbi:hypothetical protein APSETT444_009621 [Aspergillus pseudonomiae]